MLLGIVFGLFIILVVYLFALYKRKTRTAKPIGKQPPCVGGLSFWRVLSNPTVFLNETRKACGDVFILDVLGLKLFFVFSTEGLRQFYKLKEADASFQEATRGFLGYKVPEEIMCGSMTTVLQVLRRDFSSKWLSIISQTVDEEIERMGAGPGEFEVFQWTKECAHKAGFRAWIGKEATETRYFAKLLSAFEVIDPEHGFKNMKSLLMSILTRRRKERVALRSFISTVSEIFDNREVKDPSTDFLSALHEAHADLSDTDRYARVAIDVLMIHIASQSNLFAAISWCIIDLVSHESYVERVREECRLPLDEMYLIEQCYHESIRLAQQSLTLRLVMNNVSIDGFTVVQGYYVATLLSCLNHDDSVLKEATTYRPEEHYGRNGKCNKEGLVNGDNAEFQISTFGHGSHACPGRRFATTAVRVIVSSLFSKYDIGFAAHTKKPTILASQIGAVGRCVDNVYLTYRKR